MNRRRRRIQKARRCVERLDAIAARCRFNHFLPCTRDCRRLAPDNQDTDVALASVASASRHAWRRAFATWVRTPTPETEAVENDASAACSVASLAERRARLARERREQDGAD